MSGPKLITLNEQIDAIGDIRYKLEGELVPALHILLGGAAPVYFEHHVVFWKTPDLNIVLRARGGLLGGAIKRKIAGMPFLLTEAQGKGAIAFSRNAAGQIISYTLKPGEQVFVREHQWLAATGNIAFDPKKIKGIANNLLGGNGFWQVRFVNTSQQDGVVWLHAYGNMFAKDLQAGEAIDVEPGAWVYFTDTVTMSPKMYGLRTAILAGNQSLWFNRFTGPGTVGLQSMYYHPIDTSSQKQKGQAPIYSSEDNN